MTGICGWIGLTPPNEPAAVLARMAEVLPPMGVASPGRLTPASGLCVKGDANELADAADEGMHSVVDGTLLRWTDIELAELASAQGHAKALLRAYRKYGSDFLPHLLGHFALAVLDPTTDTLLIAIDRIGTQPLYYRIIEKGGLVFGSSVNAVRRHPDIDTRLNAQGLYNYMYFHIVPSPGTIFQGIKKLEPGQLLLFQKGETKVRRYWYPSFTEERGGESFSSLKEDLIHTLETTIGRCLTDAAVGSFLSGGIDSSIVSGVLAKLLGKPPKSYSIGFSAEGYDEMEYARIAARHFGLDHIEYYVTPEDVVESISQVARAYDEPFGNSSAIPAYFCARLAKENGTNIMLAGDGGDEIFAGNERYVTQKLFDGYNRMPAWVRKRVLEPLFLDLSLNEKIPLIRKIRRYIELARLPMPDRMQAYNLLDRMTSQSVFDAGFLDNIDTQQPINSLRETYNGVKSSALVNRMLYLDWKITLADNDLRKVNRMCELAGIKVVYPMLDDDMVEFANRVPPSLKLNRLRLRYFVKQALKDFLPPDIITKSKHGFGLPFGIWLLSSPVLQQLIFKHLTALKRRGIIRSELIEQLLKSHRMEHAAYYGTMVWVLAMLELWFEEHSITL
jgi:asparagine synthase (glutamine-hydrolysing)